MKILIINKFLYPNGGSETYIFKLGEELVKAGCEVQYFGMEHEGRIVGNELNLYTKDMDFHTGKLKKLLYPLQIIYSREAYKKLTSILESFEPDVVHLNNFNFQITPSVIYAVRDYEKKHKGKKIKLIFTAHDYQWVCPNHMLKNPLTNEVCFKCEGGCFGACSKNKCIHGSRIKSLLGTIEAGLYWKLKTYSKVDLIICPSEFLRKKLLSYKGIEDKLITMHNFIDRNEINEPKEDYVLYFGRYAEEKGVRTLLKVCSELPQVNFKFAGGGPLEDLVNNLSNVETLGFKKGRELIELVAKARLVVFPSEWYENCPYTVMESQMYGTAVLASDIGGVPELMENNITGELFIPGDSEDLKRHLLSMLGDEEKLIRYTENCRKVSFDTPREYVNKYIELINALN